MPNLPNELHDIVNISLASLTIGVSIVMLVLNVRQLIRTSINRSRSAWIGRLQTAFDDSGRARQVRRRSR
jgi:hypothetical protein